MQKLVCDGNDDLATAAKIVSDLDRLSLLERWEP